MARKITECVVNAFYSRKPFTMGNSHVSVENGETIMYLHGNAIAKFDKHDRLWVCDGVFQSNTTKERLNGLTGVSVYQRKGQWYLNDQSWDGEWTIVN